MYRPQIKVIDCTIRDGGLMNDSNFTFETVRAIYAAVCAAGVDIVELGYRNNRAMLSSEQYGPWRFCDDELLKRVTDGVETTTKLAIMQDSHKASADDLAPKSESVVDMVRVATYVKDIDKAIHIANCATEKGYETTINIMAISHAIERELDEALQQVEEETKVSACYLVDSFGALYSEDVDYLVAKFQKWLKTKETGVHFHNNQQLGYANTIEAIIKNVNWLDGTLYGLGRAAGNCPLELLIGFLKNPKFDIRPLFKVIGEQVLPLQKSIEWGYCVPYMIAGLLNVHPEDALELMSLPADDPRRSDFVAFYERMADPDA
ncbi:MAG: aldolase catalytic domain-containing protein [Chitinispirillaceae bacterium]|jgi:4-hydroxy 2-oxovalerate aldolase|nr:aldolase catalytic domain-containing protein [Chitinispirillaceae bacterium]